MDYDSLFKELLREMLPGFLRAFFPETAARLDLTQIEFSDKEVFTDFPDDQSREADLIAQVPIIV